MNIRHCLFLAICLSLPLHAQSTKEKRIQAVIDRLGLEPSQYAVLVTDLESGEKIFDSHSRREMCPASTMKLLVSVAALEKLTPGYQFQTSVHLTDEDLCLVGGGDPSLMMADVAVMVNKAKARGVKEIGDIIVDDTLFPQEVVYNKIQFADDLKKGFAAPTSSLALEYNKIVVTVQSDADEVKVYVEPKLDGIDIVNDAKIVKKNFSKAPDVEVFAKDGKLIVRVSGRLKANAKYATVTRSISDPAIYAGLAFAHLFVRADTASKNTGGVFHGKVRKQKCHGDKIVLNHVSSPLREIIKVMNKDSNNFIAEMLLRMVGEGYSCSEGTETICQWLDSNGLDSNTVNMDNGSGLSRTSTISAHEINQIVRFASTKFVYKDDFVNSLSIGGVDGTIKAHFKKNASLGQHVYGKTGYLDAVSTLAGIAKKNKKPSISFVFFFNGLPVPNSKFGLIRACRKTC